MTHSKGVHYALYPSNWLAGTRGLTPAEAGVYITLVCMMYEREAPLLNDTARLARMCNCPAGTFKKILAVLLDEGKIIATRDGLWNRRVGLEITEATTRRKAASDHGRKAAEARWQSDRRENEAVTLRSDERENCAPLDEKLNEINKGVMPAHCPRNASQSQSQSIYGGGGSAGAREGDLTLRERLLHAAGIDPSKIISPGPGAPGASLDMAEVGRWQRDLGFDDDGLVAAVAEIRTGMREVPSSLRYFTKPLQRIDAANSAPPLTPEATPGTARHSATPAPSSNARFVEMAARQIAEEDARIAEIRARRNAS